ncbi:MAG: tubulin-like doman-containing protein [Pirellulaceae bacterium]
MSDSPAVMNSPPAHQSEPIPGYVLRQRVGAGGYGEVWAADAPGGLTKAIKFVYGLMDESRAAREFKSLSLIKGVRHPFLLSLERIEVHNGQLLIVTELADGSLKDRYEECLKQGLVGIPREELLAHLHDAADALDYMNSQHSLQHLDVKPENLLLVGGRIKVADFGLVKDIQEVSASLMGGLTPIYAPPEVFDARPSRRSDQYSLAIVYQEMLTGVLPFPGRTAAQLAAQHMTARPRLAALPAHDQPVIERALAKDPLQRFGSCRELVEELLHTKTSVPPRETKLNLENGALGTRQTSSFNGLSQAALAGNADDIQPIHPEQEMLRRLESVEQAARYESQGHLDVAENAAHEAVSTATIDVPRLPTSLVDLPPLEVDLAVNACRPTLFVGVGGLAGKSLQQLRRRLEDRCDVQQREKFRFLLLDTDSRELLESSYGPSGAAFRPDETMVLPLRKSADYRNDSQKYLDWLSRRWLFNIPRSQQTEGIRPFGRLAFVDHAEEVMQRLRDAISPLTAAAKSAGGQTQPRIVIVGSSSGGAASGMLPDLTFAVRQILDEQQAGGTVDLLLMHGTSRQPAAQELAAVNTFALLTELNQCLRVGGNYPGDFSCGLKPRAASERAIENLYLAHLGEELGNDQFLTACDRVAEYLFLDAATPAGTYLNACRATEPKEKRQEVTLRTFGLVPISISETAVSRGVESLCRATAVLWHGEPQEQPTPSISARIADRFQKPANCPVAAKNAELELLAAEQAKSLGLELDTLVENIHQLTTEELGGEPNAIFQRIIQESPMTLQAAPPVEKWFAGSARLFGALGCDWELSSSSPLQSALVKRLPQLVAPLGLRMRDWLLKLPEEPTVRAYGGQWCAKWFRTHLKNLVENAKSTRAQIGVQLNSLEQKLAVAAKTSPKAVAKNKDGASGAEGIFMQHCQLRLYQLASHVTIQFAQSLASYVSQASDQLNDFGRDIKHLVGQFTVSEAAPEDAIELAAHSLLGQEEESSALALDSFFQEHVFSATGFRAMLQGGEQRHKLLAHLRQQARQLVLESLRRVNLSALVRELGQPGPRGTSQLGEQIAAAQPWLQQVGGERRLLYMGGTGSESEGRQCLTPSEVADLVTEANFKQLPAVIPSSAAQVVFCYEIGNIPLTHAAARLINHRTDFAQAASRLHARTDVSWQELRP